MKDYIVTKLEEVEEFAYTIRIELERGYITEEFAKKQAKILVERINKQLKELEALPSE